MLNNPLNLAGPFPRGELWHWGTLRCPLNKRREDFLPPFRTSVFHRLWKPRLAAGKWPEERPLTAATSIELSST